MHMLNRILLFVFTGMLLCASASAQTNLPPDSYTSTNKKAIKYFKEAKKAISIGKNEDAEKNALKAIKEDPNFAEAYTLLGYVYIDAGKNDKAIEHLEKSVALAGHLFPTNYYQLGEIYFYTCRYDEALKHFTKFLSFPRIHPDMRTRTEFMQKCAEFGVDAVKNPKPFKPVNCGASINTANDEYFPTVTADNTTFYFTRKFKERNLCSGTDGQEDFFTCTRDEKGSWRTAVPFKEINSACNEGAPNVSADGQFMFYTACGDINNEYGPSKEKGYGSCDIFYSDKYSGKWTRPVNIGKPVNSQHWETQPSFSSDGKTLYFIRGILGRDGKKTGDIYYSVIGEDNKFGPPVKLGPNINTEGSEESVFIHPDNMTLYFASDGHVGLGGYDIFVSKRQPDGEWGPAVNLGYPINTCKDENSLLVDPTGRLAYFASDREGGSGGLDIYNFEMPQEFQPEKITYAKGKVYDSITRKPLAARFELIDLESGKTMVSSYSNASGNFLLTITANKNYMANVSMPGYLFYSEKFRMKEVSTDYNHPFILNIPMLPVDTGKSTILNNVYFDVDKYDLRPESYPELNKLVQFLRNNPDISIEIAGHTDNTGDDKKNLILSDNRAKAVVDYLVKEQIDPKRLRWVGYGETRPRYPNDTDEHKQLNRRTEYRIIGTKNAQIKIAPTTPAGTKKPAGKK